MPTNTYVALQTQVLGTAVSSVTFSSIPQGYTDLVLVVSGRSTNGSADDSMYIQVNGDTAGANYSFTRLLGDGSSASSYRISNQVRTTVDGIAGGSTAAGTFNAATINFQNYSNTTTNKTILSRSGIAGSYTLAAVGLWRNTAAITTILLTLASVANFAVGSTFTIYGIAATSVGAKATGGYITSDSQYYYHTFFGNGTFAPTQSISADVLVVAGGGGGGGGIGGGGGGGGYRTATALSLSTTNYSVTVGAGGTGAANGQSYGTVGANSVFASITSTGGGYAGSGQNPGFKNGANGGSGGGTGAANLPRGTAGTGTSGEGNDGGVAYAPSTDASGTGGGGGGAGAVGGTGINASGNGGAGIISSYSGLPVGYAGGGGGGAFTGQIQNAGTATDGGGAGTKSNSAGANGTTNTGGGGGGGGYATAEAPGGNGGSGIVIVRYLKA